MGINPNIIVLRCDEPLEESIFQKIALFCNVKPDCVIENITLPNLYEAPLMLEKSGFSEVVCRELGLTLPKPDLTEWTEMVGRIEQARTHCVEIGLVGKYVGLHDAYLSVAEALHHAGFYHNVHVNIHWIDSEGLRRETIKDVLSGIDGVIVPGGFGNRGIEGMILAAKYAREHRIPYFGICLGMQIAVIEFAGMSPGSRTPIPENSMNSAGIRSSILCPGQSDDIDKGGPCVWAYPCDDPSGDDHGTLLREALRSASAIVTAMNSTMITGPGWSCGLTLSGISPDGRLVETVELTELPFYVGVQYHPEFKSRPNRPHPLFLGFIGAAAAAQGKGTHLWTHDQGMYDRKIILEDGQEYLRIRLRRTQRKRSLRSYSILPWQAIRRSCQIRPTRIRRWS